ncbi:hypothetical protein PZA11_002384 [Diplocarpon coronariae]
MSIPKEFLWGFAPVRAPKADGRGPSIWDTCYDIPGKIADESDGSIACDSYNHTHEDIVLLKETGAKAYCFSNAWPRIIPLGGRNDQINFHRYSFLQGIRG